MLGIFKVGVHSLTVSDRIPLFVCIWNIITLFFYLTKEISLQNTDFRPRVCKPDPLNLLLALFVNCESVISVTLSELVDFF